ncbi:MAG: hypothetical protein MI975_01965 [Cytophagales bacterium]|nr:hypothetical protein [Cytophagales bacterium]
MYFRGRLSIDPSQLSKIEKVSPESGFKKLLFGLTGGQFGEKKEIETFKALNILQQIHGSLKSVGVDDIVRLTHDDIDIYYDTKGERNDLNFAMDKYQIEIDDSMSTHFKTLGMVLEHEDDTYKYLIEISINRSHKEHEYPIEMVVSGLLKEFNPRSGETREALKAKMQSLFKDQESYNMFVTTRKLAFEQFLESIRFETMKHIRIDDIKMDIKTRMVVQKEKRQAPQQTLEPEYQGMPYGYFGFGDLILYAWLWSEMSFDHNIHLSDVDLVTDRGDFISSIGEDGIDAAETSIMDYHQDFDARIEAPGLDSTGMDGAESVEMGGMEEVVDTESSKSWFDGIFEDGDFDFGDW